MENNDESCKKIINGENTYSGLHFLSLYVDICVTFIRSNNKSQS